MVSVLAAWACALSGWAAARAMLLRHEIERRLPVLVVFDELGFAVLLGGDGGCAELAIGEQLAEALLGLGVVAEVVGDRADAERDRRVRVIEVGSFGSSVAL